MEQETVKQNISNKSQWMRILYMIMFAVILYLVMMLVTVVVIVQLLFALFTGKPNDDIGDFASDLSQYVYRIVAFLTYTDDRRPFPFNNWEQEEREPGADKGDSIPSVEDGGDAEQSGDDKHNKPE